MKKRVKLLLLCIAGLLLLAYLMIGEYFHNITLNRDRIKLPDIERIAGFDENNAFMPTEIVNDWFEYESRYEDVYITSRDGLKLHAYQIENFENSSWVIIAHGYAGNADDMIYNARKFYNMGLNVIVVDLRGHGQSEGNYIGMGWKDRRDIVDWINYILTDNPNDNIILYGVSLGASAVMMTTGEKLPQNVKLAIEDSGCTSAWELFEYQLKLKKSLPPFLVISSAEVVTFIKNGYFLGLASSVKQLSNNKLPILFIHGDKDEVVPLEMLDKLYNSTTSFKEKLIVEDAGHTQAAITNPVLYWGAIEKFIERYL
ncbi:MAG: alpha/beta hydrolase [Bacilli bacterium]|nr:alpha/beta hydrolase [Bacilli bacterium]